MGIINVILGSSVFMGLLAFVFAVFCIRFLIHGFLGGTSTLLRIIASVVAAVIAYYCWHLAMAATGGNVIDRFVFDSWHDLVQFIKSIKF